MTPHAAAGLLVWALVGLLDQGQHADMDEVGRRLRDGSLFRWLKDEHSVGVGSEAEVVLLEEFGRLHDAVEPGRKFGVRRNGLALLLAWCVELYQQGLSRASR